MRRTPPPRLDHPRDDRGASLVEYALLVALIAMVCFAAVVLLGEVTDDDFRRNANSVQAA